MKEVMENGNVQYQDEETGVKYNTPEEYQAAKDAAEFDDKGESEQALATVDEKLEAALAPLSRQYSEISINKEIFRKYMVPGATDAEVFFCMGKTRALGLDPLLPGYVHYIKFPGKPYDLFVGYPEYLKQAYDNGLEHLSYEFTEDDDGQLVSVITTLDIKNREKPFVWETWYDEVVGMTSGKVNWRWTKAPRSQLRKCGGVDAIRYSGLLTTHLPYIPEEMPDPPALGYRSITQEQLDAHPETAATDSGGEEIEMEIGTVNAADHQIDTSSMRVNYHTILGELNLFESDDQRRKWQEDVIGSTSSANWSAADYLQAMREIATGKVAIWIETENQKPDPESQEQAENAPERSTEEDEGAETPPAEEEQQDDAETPAETDDPEEPETFLTNSTHEEIKACLLLFPDKRYLKVGSTLFRQRSYGIIEHKYNSVRSILETEGQLIVATLRTELAELSKAESEAVDAAADEEADRAAWEQMNEGE